MHAPTDSGVPAGRHGVGLSEGDVAAVDVLGRDYDRILLVANNPILGDGLFERLAIGDRDLVIQFNACLHFDRLRQRPGHRAYAVNRTIIEQPGFLDGDRPIHPFDERPGAAMIFVTGQPPAPDGVVGRWLEARRDRLTVIVPTPGRGRDEVPDYPADKRPSTGFAMLLLLRWARRLQAVDGRPPVPLILVGFTARGIPMHGWAYERRWLDAHPEIERRHDPWRLPKTLWWTLAGKKLQKFRRRVGGSAGLPIGRI